MSRMKYRRRSVLLPMLLLLAGLWAWVCVPDAGGSFNFSQGFYIDRPITAVNGTTSATLRRLRGTMTMDVRRYGWVTPFFEAVDVAFVLDSANSPMPLGADRDAVVAKLIAKEPDTKLIRIVQRPLGGSWNVSVNGIHTAFRTGRSVRIVPQGALKLSGGVACVAALIWIVAIDISNRRYKHAIARGLCLGCGYSIGTLAVCPECGRAPALVR